MELYIIRHAQSTNNALGQDISRRVMDAPLTELGHRQAEIVAQHLASADFPEMIFRRLPQQSSEEHGSSAQAERLHYGLTHLYCSAMHRALQTSLPIARALGLRPEVWVDIHELGGIYMEEDGGYVGYPGFTRAEILAQFEDYHLPDTIREDGWWERSRGMEVEAEMIMRAVRVAEQVRTWAAQSDGSQRIGLVTHGLFASWLLKAIFNQLPGTDVYYNHYNTAITRLDFAPDGMVHLRYLNRIAHLPLDMISY